MVQVTDSVLSPEGFQGLPMVSCCVCSDCAEARKEWMMGYRNSVNKHKSAKKFRSDSTRTKALNMRGAPMRGGIRL